MALTPEERALRARIAAYDSWAHTENRAGRTAKGLEAFLARFEREVDPERRLPPAERAKRAEAARRAYMSRLALSAARSRRKDVQAASPRSAA